MRQAAQGNFGDVKPISDGVSEMRIHFGPGYRGYYAREGRAEYLSAALEEDDPALFLAALSDVAKARGMTKMAKDAGLGRESLYKALAPGAKPRYDTVLKLARAAGVKFTVEPVHA